MAENREISKKDKKITKLAKLVVASRRTYANITNKIDSILAYAFKLIYDKFFKDKSKKDKDGKYDIGSSVNKTNEEILKEREEMWKDIFSTDMGQMVIEEKKKEIANVLCKVVDSSIFEHKLGDNLLDDKDLGTFNLSFSIRDDKNIIQSYENLSGPEKKLLNTFVLANEIEHQNEYFKGEARVGVKVGKMEEFEYKKTILDGVIRGMENDGVNMDQKAIKDVKKHVETVLRDKPVEKDMIGKLTEVIKDGYKNNKHFETLIKVNDIVSKGQSKGRDK